MMVSENSIIFHINKDTDINKIIDEYQSKKEHRYLFLENEDIEILNVDVFQKYIELMEKLNIPVAFYGFYKLSNRLFNGKPNPIINVKINDDRVAVNRTATEGLICIDLEKIGDTRFNTKYKNARLQIFLYELSVKNLIPFYGLYFDIKDSYKYFEEVTDITKVLIQEANETKKNINTELDLYGKENKIVIQNSKDVDGILKYVKEKYK